jgi:hypothetical protein
METPKFRPFEPLAMAPRVPTDFLLVREELSKLRANPDRELLEALADAVDALETIATTYRHSAIFKICGIDDTISQCVAVLGKYPSINT